MLCVKVSVSLPEVDIAFLDAYAARGVAVTRSAALRQAIDLLRASELEDSYAEAFGEWSAEEEADWSFAAADGLVDA